MRHETIIYEHSEAVRLDQFLNREKPDLSRSFIQKLVADGNVRIDGKETKPSRMLRGGESIELDIPEPEILEVEPEDIPLDIVYEDSDIIAVNKPAGLVVHPAPGHHKGTLVNALLHHCTDLSGVGGVLRPGIVHRLDAGTTGIIVVAKNDAAHQRLSEQFQQRQVIKEYRAIVFGTVHPENGEIDEPIGRDRKDRKKISPQTDLGKPAVTRYKTIKQWKAFSYLDVRILTGRTHQIRVHLNHIGHPLVGDDVYGGRRWKGVTSTRLKKAAHEFGRPALHALYIEFRHPASGKLIQLKAEIPMDMLEFIDLLDGVK